MEPESITGNLNSVDDVPEEKPVTRAPVEARKPRPSWNTALVKAKVNVAKSLKDQLERNPLVANKNKSDGESDEVKVGEPCKNGGCKAVSLDLRRFF